MCGGMPLRVSGMRFESSEALYQACRFPDLPEIQREIAANRSPMGAKMTARRERAHSREDWDGVRVPLMRWCLAVKLADAPQRFRHALAQTEHRPIVEQSRRDRFWGAVPAGAEELVGENTLGRLLMELRSFDHRGRLLPVPAPPIPLRLGGQMLAASEAGPAGPWFAEVPAFE